MAEPDNPFLSLPDAGAPAAPPASDNPFLSLKAGGPSRVVGKAAPAPSMWDSIVDAFTGASRIDPRFKDSPEFLEQAMSITPAMLAKIQAGAKPDEVGGADGTAVMRSAITSDPKTALDILSKAVPGLEAMKDRHGNLMLRAPGHEQWAYLNKPGFSQRDVDETLTQLLATLPFMGIAAPAKAGVATRVLTGAGGMAAGETARQGMEIASGSDQGLKPAEIAINAGFGGVLAPGVPGDIKRGVSNVLGSVVNPVRQLSDAGAAKVAERTVGEAMARDLERKAPPDVVEKAYPGYANGAPIGSAEELQARAGILMRDPNLMGDQGLLPTQYLARGIDAGGEGVRDVARVAANWDGASRQTMQDMVQQRYQGQADRFSDMLRELSDSPLTRGQSKEEIKKSAAEFTRRNYIKSFDDGAHGLQSDVLDSILDSDTVQKAAKEAIRTLSDFRVFGATRTPRLINDRGDFSLELWDMIKRKVDTYGQDALARVKQGRGGESEVMQYQGLSRVIRDELDRLVPSYSTSRGAAERVFNASDALDAGAKFASWQGRHGNEEATKAIAEMTKNERELFARGFLDWWQTELPELKKNRNVAELFNTPALMERFSIALGPDKADKFMAHMLAELALDRARSAFGNSTTARQLAQMMGVQAGAGGLLSAGIMATHSNDPGALLTSAMLGAAAAGTRRAMVQTGQRKVAEQITRLLMSDDPKTFLKGASVLRQMPEMRQNLVDFLKATDLPQVGRNVVAREAAQGVTND